MREANHIAIIPARKNSKGLKLKNRLLFNYTNNFLKKTNWFNKIIFASDDKYFISKCRKSNFYFYKRTKKNALDDSSIKSLMLEVSKNLNLNKETILWLFYLTIPERNLRDFNKLRVISQKKNFLSAISFVSPKTHPYDCWIIKKKLSKFIKNDIYRRQDKIKLFEHHHYLCAFKIKELKKLNSELINSNTTPIILKKDIIEIDTKKDLITFIKRKRV
jgi:CMP-N-acetylneuraminic acid synthetase